MEIQQDYLGIFNSNLKGALEIVGGILLLWATDGQNGDKFIEIGYNDIKYGKK